MGITDTGCEKSFEGDELVTKGVRVNEAPSMVFVEGNDFVPSIVIVKSTKLNLPFEVVEQQGDFQNEENKKTEVDEERG
ncbi:hypothetical protein HPP92_004936 [Vanilla planifolia]|uniref:Uncharacterized protein n=1 Tax=Vanilla planifolia TaxID=51239 RepID=A0A835RSV4_VANPL|nr:hypothetical protein HPP92_004936 [Vanilla planifolia]